jgi:kynurenine formamidase
VHLTESEFRALFDRVRTQGPGALRHLTADRVVAAAGLVTDGMTVGLGRPLDTEKRVDNPKPAVHRMTSSDVDTGPVHFAKDYIGVDYHNEGHSHIDALSHVAFDGSVYDGQSVSIEVLADGLVGRGVLLDVPRQRGVAWLEPGEHVYLADIEAAERDQGTRVGTGDILLVRTGHARRQRELPPWDTGRAKAGLHPTIAPFLAERRVAALGSDGNNDTAPSGVDGVGFPMHVLAITAMGMHLLDYLWLEDLAEHCARKRRWEFLLVVAPLRVEGGTGSPVNPIAVM